MSNHPDKRNARSPAAAAGLAATALLLSALLAAGPAAAQNSPMQEVLNRLDRLQREVSMLQRDVYQNSPRQQSGNASGAAVSADKWTAAITLRQTRLEQEIRNLTGKVEVLGHQLQQLRAETGRLAARVRAEPAVSPPGPAEAPQGQPRDAAGPAPSPSRQQSRSGVLGTIPERLAVTSPQGAADGAGHGSAAASEPRLSAEDQYRRAVNLIQQKQDFAAAEGALRTLIKQHPEHRLASSSWYWLGRTHFVRKQYRDAAFAFADGYKKHPEGAKAADNLFNLGISLSRLNRQKEACTAYGQLLTRFPLANQRLKTRVAREQARNKCV